MSYRDIFVYSTLALMYSVIITATIYLAIDDLRKRIKRRQIRR